MSFKIRKRVVISSESESSPAKENNSSESSQEECVPPSLFERLQRRRNYESSTSIFSQQLSPFKSRIANSEDKENVPSCSICFTSPAVKPSHPDCCNHTFCCDCLLKWSDMLNTCPLCKRKFHFICDLYQTGKKTKILDKKQPKYLEDDSYFNQMEEAIYCAICGTDTNEQVLLLCDGCNVGMHTYCLSPPLDEVPPGEWFCPECEESRQPLEISNRTQGRVATRTRRRRRRRSRGNDSTRSRRQRRGRRPRARQQSHTSVTTASRNERNSQHLLSRTVASNNLTSVCPNIIDVESDESSSGYASDDSFLKDHWDAFEPLDCEHSSLSSEYSEVQLQSGFQNDRPKSCLPRDIMYRYGIGGARATGCSR